MKWSIIWQFALRLVVGSYWFYFSYQKWFDRSWTEGMIATAAQGSNIPIYDEILRTLALPNWSLIALLMTIVEGVVGVMILFGLLVKVAAAIGTFLSLNLLLTFAFCNCSLATDFPLVFWFYFAPLVLNIQLVFDESSNTLGLQKVLNRTPTRTPTAT